MLRTGAQFCDKALSGVWPGQAGLDAGPCEAPNPMLQGWAEVPHSAVEKKERSVSIFLVTFILANDLSP